MSPPKPKKNIENRAQQKNNYAANDAAAEMNISTYPCTAAQIPPPPRQSRFTDERTRARTKNRTATDRIINKTPGRQRTPPTTHARDSPDERNEVSKSRRFLSVSRVLTSLEVGDGCRERVPLALV
jgi:hypothetical protein